MRGQTVDSNFSSILRQASCCTVKGEFLHQRRLEYQARNTAFHYHSLSAFLDVGTKIVH